MNNLKDISLIQKVLKDAGYHDISRISNEIYEFSETTGTPLEAILKRIETNEPWEYIRGFTEFRDENFKVNASTLIPRIETEMLIDIAKDEIMHSPTPYSDIIDVGTGSGCIAITLQKVIPTQAKIYATDISTEALEIAKENESTILQSKMIDFAKTNLIEGLDLQPNSNVLILANLPYIPTEQYLKLDSSVIDYEPRTALDGGKDGLTYCKELIAQVRAKQLKGTGIFEIEPSTLKNFSPKPEHIFQDQYNQDRFVLIRFS